MKSLDWIEITNENCPTLAKYGVKPFRIMKRKMRNSEGEVWNNINYYDAKAEAEKLGYRLPTENEMEALQEHYKNTQTKVSTYDEEFLGIEELSYNEDVCYEWLEGGFFRGGYWINGSDDGAFTLDLGNPPSYTDDSFGFRCASDLVEISESKESSNVNPDQTRLENHIVDLSKKVDHLTEILEKHFR